MKNKLGETIALEEYLSETLEECKLEFKYRKMLFCGRECADEKEGPCDKCSEDTVFSIFINGNRPLSFLKGLSGFGHQYYQEILDECNSEDDVKKSFCLNDLIEKCQDEIKMQRLADDAKNTLG